MTLKALDRFNRNPGSLPSQFREIWVRLQDSNWAAGLGGGGRGEREGEGEEEGETRGQFGLILDRSSFAVRRIMNVI